MAVQKRAPKVRLKRWKTDDWYYTPVGYRFIKTAFTTPVRRVARLHVKGKENVPMEGGVLLACNHFSWADPVLLGAALPRPAFYLAKERLFVNPFSRWFFETMGQIKVDRDAGGNEDAISTAVRLLAEGLVVGVFPEGTRSRYGELKRGKTGLARIAARSGAPVLPVALTTAQFWPKHAAMPKWGEAVYLNVGEPVRYDVKPGDAEDRQRMREVTDDVMERIRKLLREANAARDAGDKWV